MNEIFCIRLKKLRKEARITQEEMAKYLGINRATYSGYERDIIMPPFDKIKAISDKFNVSIDYLMGSTNFRHHDDVVVKKPNDITDIGVSIETLLDDLKDKTNAYNIDGVQLDDDSRDLLISSLENSQKLLKLIKNQSKK